ncbi:helix-turn-helix transcriptional regulator [Acetivibrio straminisolvens]|jgi:predicted DNA-binding transcriptional regulator YafY|uniref:Transcriptional regulator n=1 Tax=Acetivibrio straminisolvens JCM 21531 TaxID=1294263 RepID=W4VBQ5_9FIRM|nr:YafY family protein [Acetivibrio straminisolvens]GAE90184.1 transcriptional regulator [Acetivibrio straminisolvens JCM 21531]
MQIERLFEIIYLLLNKKKMTAQELAEHFEVSKRTILRDIDALAMAGIPVYTTQGKGGGISIMDSFLLNKAVLSENDKNQILFALQSLSVTNAIDTKHVLSKLQNLFDKTNPNWIEVDFSRWGSGDSDKRKFEILKNAILGKKAISFRYVSSYGKETQRRVYPLKLIFKSKAWYLQAFCTNRQDYRTFKINRVLDVHITNENFDESSYSPPPIETLQERPNSIINLSILLSPQVAYRAYDEFDESCIEKCDNGWFRVTARLPEDNWLYSFLKSLGNDVCIISPAHLKEKFQ